MTRRDELLALADKIEKQNAKVSIHPRDSYQRNNLIKVTAEGVATILRALASMENDNA